MSCYLTAFLKYSVSGESPDCRIYRRVTINAQLMAEGIIDEAKTLPGKHDDMTVLVTKLGKLIITTVKKHFPN